MGAEKEQDSLVSRAQIEIGNEKIAIFCGCEKKATGIWIVPNGVLPSALSLTQPELHFHCSWDWLIPAIKKIEMLGIDYGKITTNIDFEWSQMVRFVEWYNLKPINK